MERKFILSGAILIVLAIILGAFGAHGLKQMLPHLPEKVMSFDTGVKYQFYVGFSMLFLGLFSSKVTFSMKWIFRFMWIGTLFFSFSIYLLTFQYVWNINLKFLGPITPLGGLCLIVSWTIFIIQYLRCKSE